MHCTKLLTNTPRLYKVSQTDHQKELVIGVTEPMKSFNPAIPQYEERSDWGLDVAFIERSVNVRERHEFQFNYYSNLSITTTGI